MDTSPVVANKNSVSGVECETQINLEGEAAGGFPSPLSMSRAHRVRLCEFTQVWNIQPPTTARNDNLARVFMNPPPPLRHQRSNKMQIKCFNNQTNTIDRNCHVKSVKNERMLENIYQQHHYLHQQQQHHRQPMHQSCEMRRDIILNSDGNCRLAAVSANRQVSSSDALARPQVSLTTTSVQEQVGPIDISVQSTEDIQVNNETNSNELNSL